MIGQRPMHAANTAASVKEGSSQARMSQAEEKASFNSLMERVSSADHSDEFESLMTKLENDSTSLTEQEPIALQTLDADIKDQALQDQDNALEEHVMYSDPEAEVSDDESVADDTQSRSGNLQDESTELPLPADMASLGQQPLEQGADTSLYSDAEVSSTSSAMLPANETAAKIAEEIRKRNRSLDEQRWTFSLRDSGNGQITVTVEKLPDHTWLVELETGEQCSDDELLALQHRLNERLGQVNVRSQAIQ